jgi:DNA-binding transcriptional ArsR family regulator
MPSAFTWPRPRAILDPPWQPTVIYPVRGIDALWRSAPGDAPAALAGVLGASRARLLMDLGEPADTTTLAVRHAMAASAVSRHLHALRSAGLLVAQRDRRRVLYRRTALGSALCAAQEPTRPVRGPEISRRRSSC